MRHIRKVRGLFLIILFRMEFVALCSLVRKSRQRGPDLSKGHGGASDLITTAPIPDMRRRRRPHPTEDLEGKMTGVKLRTADAMLLRSLKRSQRLRLSDFIRDAVSEKVARDFFTATPTKSIA